VTLAGGDLRFEAVNPPAGDGLEAKSRRDGHLPFARRRDQRQPLTPRLGEVEPNRPEAQPASVAAANRVLAVGLEECRARPRTRRALLDPMAFLLAWDREPRRPRRLRTPS
jgi:hypothetical protein